jgi:ATP adenylyltransferase
LNKFPVIPEHFILATKDWKEQSHLLEEDDIRVTYECLKTWRAHGSELFAFFNSGEHSGASQPHRHLQFLPVESMKAGADVKDWIVLADTLASNKQTGKAFDELWETTADVTSRPALLLLCTATSRQSHALTAFPDL